MLRTAPLLTLTAALLSTAALAQRSPAAIPCPDFGGDSEWMTRARVFAGGGPTTRTFDASDTTVFFRAIRALRDSTEELQIDPVGGLRVELSHRSGFTARIGGTYRLYRSVTRVRSDGPVTFDSLREVRTPTGVLIRRDSVFSQDIAESERYNRHQTATVVGGVGFHRWFGAVAPYAFVEVGYEFLLATRGEVAFPQFADPTQPVLLVPTEPLIAAAPGVQVGGTIGVDIAFGSRLFFGPSVSYTRLGGLGSEVDLDYTQRSVTGALNVGVRF